MAEDFNEITLQTPFGKLGARGGIVVLVFAVLIILGTTIWHNWMREQEHNEIIRKLEYLGCQTRLAIWRAEQPRGPAGWLFDDMPQEMYGCLPEWSINRKRRE